MLENQTATREQSCNEQLYRIDIERVRIVNDCRVWSAFVVKQQGVFQVSVSFAFCILVLQSPLKFALWRFQHARYMLEKHPVPISHS